MMPVKVVHLHKIAGVSGSETHLRLLLTALDRTAFEPVFVALGARSADDRAYLAELRAAGVRVEVLPIRGHFDPVLVARLVSWLRRERPSIVHTHLIHADVHGVVAARLAGVPVIISTKHNDDPFRTRRLVVALERWLARRVNTTIAISEWLRRYVLATTGQREDRVVTVRYGYDPDIAGAPELQHPCPIRTGVPTVLAVGRLVAQKGHDVLIRAFSRVRTRIPEAALVIVGAGPRREELERLIQRCSLSDRVLLAGHRPDVGAFLGASAVVAHPSRWEGFGMVLLEAMAHRRAIVASAVSAIPEIVTHGETGLLVPAEDEAALADALIRLLADPATAGRMGETGLQRLRQEFSLARMARQTEEVYRRAFAGVAGAGRTSGGADA